MAIFTGNEMRLADQFVSGKWEGKTLTEVVSRDPLYVWWIYATKKVSLHGISKTRLRDRIYHLEGEGKIYKAADGIYYLRTGRQIFEKNVPTSVIQDKTEHVVPVDIVYLSAGRISTASQKRAFAPVKLNKQYLTAKHEREEKNHKKEAER